MINLDSTAHTRTSASLTALLEIINSICILYYIDELIPIQRNSARFILHTNIFLYKSICIIYQIYIIKSIWNDVCGNWKYQQRIVDKSFTFRYLSLYCSYGRLVRREVLPHNFRVLHWKYAVIPQILLENLQ